MKVLMDTELPLLPPSSAEANHEADDKRQKSSSDADHEADDMRQKSSEDDDELEPDVKRQKLSLPPTKLCIICSSLSVDGDKAYNIVIADLDSSRHAAASKTKGDFISIAPTFRLEREGDSKGFCLLGSTLYIFESIHRKTDPPRKSVYTIDLSKYDLTKPSLKKLEKSELGSSVPDMKQRKRSPYATPTPDGKILVLSALIWFDPFAETAGENDFELYDPDAKTWQELPGIRYDWRGYCRAHSYIDYIRILAFTFIRTSTFVLQTTTGLMFSLDLESIDKGWQQRHTFFGAGTLPFYNGRFLVIEDQLCVTPWGAYDIKKELEFPKWFSFPLPSYGDDIELAGPSAVTLLHDVNNGKFNFCNLEIGISKETSYPHLIINPFTCDLTKYKEDKEKKGNSAELSRSISIGESFNFRLDGEECELFIPLELFSF